MLLAGDSQHGASKRRPDCPAWRRRSTQKGFKILCAVSPDSVFNLFQSENGVRLMVGHLGLTAPGGGLLFGRQATRRGRGGDVKVLQSRKGQRTKASVLAVAAVGMGVPISIGRCFRRRDGALGVCKLQWTVVRMVFRRGER